jgi:hypothetical protein
MKRDIRVPDPATPIETWIDRENKKEDEANVEELERTSKDYWGRSSQESDGAVPTTPPENDPLNKVKDDFKIPHKPPKNNM